MVLNAHPVLDRVRRTTTWETREGLTTLAFQAMGTRCAVKFAAPPHDVRILGERIANWTAEFEMRYSRYQPDSLVSRINANAGVVWTEIDPETERLFALCDQLVFFTRMAFDPTALPLSRLWDWKAHDQRIPTDAEVGRARSLVGWRKVERRNGEVRLPVAGMEMDLGGIGKEYAVDCVAQMIADARIPGAIVDFGQDVRVVGLPPGKPFWHIGLEDPLKPGSCWCGVAVKDAAVASSGDYQRSRMSGGRRIGHIIDPRTGYPVDNGCRAVSVIAPSCTLAGILSTTAFVLGPGDGLPLIQSQPGAAGVISTDKARVHTRNFHEFCVT